jgi:DNA modification methylase
MKMAPSALTGDEGSGARFFYQVKHDDTEKQSHTKQIDECSNCGLPQSEHHYNGACYGLCGEFAPAAARFFYTSKADQDDRIGSKHPTVKPLDLMQYLVRLICPPKGLVLDPFAGSGTTGEAAFREGMRAVLIECEAEYLKDIERRIELLMAGPDERAFKSQKAKQDGKPIDAGPLFGGKSDWDEMWTRPFERPELL